MSWDSFIAQLCSKEEPEGPLGQCVEHGAILSRANCAIWASTAHFSLSAYTQEMPTEDGTRTQDVAVDESALLLECLDDPNGTVSSPSGLRISGDKYYTILADRERNVIYLKKREGGACVALSNSALVFGSWSEALTTTGVRTAPQSAGLCNERCERVAAYLRENGS